MTQKQSVWWLVWTRCAPELEAEFNRWYDEVHIPMLSRDGHVTSVRRLKLSNEVESPQPPYLAVYEFEDVATFKSWQQSAALADARKEMQQTWGGRDMEIKARALYETTGRLS
jgi:antibiotic biosynthesis monooxygenase (ABM) superfamily enzyme